MSGPFQEIDLFGDSPKPRADSVLRERFIMPPFSVLSARDGEWQERKRKWIALGIRSEVGRGAPIGGAPMPNDREGYRKAFDASHGGSAMPACDYSKQERGDGRGRPL
jgi:hypothetical protein